MSASPSITLQTQTCASGSGVRALMGSPSLSLLPLPLFLWIPPLTSISSSLSRAPHYTLCCHISTLKFLSSLSPFCIHGHCLATSMVLPVSPDVSHPFSIPDARQISSCCSPQGPQYFRDHIQTPHSWLLPLFAPCLPTTPPTISSNESFLPAQAGLGRPP